MKVKSIADGQPMNLVCDLSAWSACDLLGDQDLASLESAADFGRMAFAHHSQYVRVDSISLSCTAGDVRFVLIPINFLFSS